MKTCIAVACHNRDKPQLKVLKQSLAKLDPRPKQILIQFNDGSRPMQEIRSSLYDLAFLMGADIILSCDCDFYLLPHILRYTRPDKTVSYCDLKKRFSDIFTLGIRLFWRGSWSGCFSFPKKVWDQVKPHYDGTDTSFKLALGGKFEFVKRPCYYDLRPFRKSSVRQSLRMKSFPKRVLYHLTRFQPW